MNGERRQDIGLKMVYVILTAIITLLLSVFFNRTYEMAVEAHQIATIATKDVAVANQCISEVNRRLGSIENKIDKLINGKQGV